ncbi:MAG: PEP-CTERM sorting domain-containing protein [Planctomycetota bacterium]
MSKNTFLTVTTSALACSLCTLPTFAAVAPTGDVDPSPPMSGQGVTVGDAAVGSLTIDGGSSFSTGTTTNDQSVIIGNQLTGDGSVLVDGAGSSLETLFLRVGVEGTAQFTASNGATVSVVDDFSIRGDNTATVTGTGTVFQAGDSIFINGPTAATLNIADNATFEIVPPTPDNRFFIGSSGNTKGVVNVTSGATLEFLDDGTAPFRTFVGTQFDTAQGELNINTGATVTLGRTDVGNDSVGNGATGVINVDGVGTTLNFVQAVTGDSTGNGAGDLMLGSGGNGTLNITGGASVNVADDIFVALGDDSTGELNVLDGTLDIGDGLFIGYNNTGPLTVGTGALITASRFVVTNTDTNPNITPGDATVTFELSKDINGDELNGLIDVIDFSFRSGSRELVLDLDDTVTFELGDVFVLVDYLTLGNNLSGAVTTQAFDNVGDDEIINFGGVDFLIDYNDILGPDDLAFTATVVPEPGSLVALLGFGAVCLARRSGRQRFLQSN